MAGAYSGKLALISAQAAAKVCCHWANWALDSGGVVADP